MLFERGESIREGEREGELMWGGWNRFLTEGVYDLRDRLRQRNSDLLIRFGKVSLLPPGLNGTLC